MPWLYAVKRSGMPRTCINLLYSNQKNTEFRALAQRITETYPLVFIKADLAFIINCL